jgi:nitronate monooxygenase
MLRQEQIMTYPQIIQGGMGVAISTWRLANAVSRSGQLGVVSGTGVAIVLIARLMDGDEGGHMRRALAHFPYPQVAERIIERYYVPGGKAPGSAYRRPPMWTLRPPAELEALTVAANFVEVWLAKEGHGNPVGINLLEKVQMPTMASLYGAMLAGVDYVIMGAGIPIQIPGILDQLAQHQPVRYQLDVTGFPGDDVYLHFNPQALFPGLAERVGALRRPLFLPIVSSVVLALALLKRSSGAVNGFVVELPTAGGHNAPPRGQYPTNERGEPIYGEKDVVDPARIAALGLPFWLAGGYGSHERLQEALAVGAQGIQVGTAFAFCEESGMTADIRWQVLRQAQAGTIDVLTDGSASPTGFPFKVVNVPGTVADPALYAQRSRICDIGYLRQLYRDENGSLHFRCAAEPLSQYVKKGGREEDTVGRKCLCNHLGAAAGFSQARSDAYAELPLVTAGDDVVNVGQFLPPGAATYSAQDVLNALLNA